MQRVRMRGVRRSPVALMALAMLGLTAAPALATTITFEHTDADSVAVLSFNADGSETYETSDIGNITVGVEVVEYVILLGDGGDQLTIDLSDAEPDAPVRVFGEGDADRLVISGGAGHTTVIHTLTSATSGTIQLDDAPLITYFELEVVVQETASVTTTLNYSTAQDIITVGTLTADVTSSAGAAISLDNPSTLLAINPGDGAVNTVLLQALPAGFAADLEVTGGDGGDDVNVTGNVAVAGSGDVRLTGGDIDVFGGRLTTDTGDIELTSTAGEVLLVEPLSGTGATLSSTSGDVTVEGTAADGSDAIRFSSGGSIDTGGTVSLTANGGPITTESGAGNGGGTTAVTAGTLEVDGTLAPGASPGVLTVAGNLVLSGESTIEMEIDGPNPGTEHDQLEVLGTVALGGATLSIAMGYTPPTSTEFTLVDNDGADAITGQFAGLAEGDAFEVDGQFLQISYAGGDGNDVTLTVVDPPSLSIVTDDTTVLEGDAATFTVTRTGTTGIAASATWSVSSDQADADDFGGSYPSGTVSLASGATTATIVVPTAEDRDVERSEAFTVTLSAPSGAELSTATSSSTIVDDDDPSAPPPQPGSSTECPDPPTVTFGDAVGTTHEDAIHCGAHLGLVEGRESGDYEPAVPATRGEIASALVGVLRVLGIELPEDPADAFADDNGSEHEDAINVLAELKIVAGREDGKFLPDSALSRAQGATLFVRMIDVVTGDALPAGRNAFEDDEGIVHEGAINALAAAGLTQGVTSSTYVPSGTVSRGALATFVLRILRHLEATA